MMVTSIYQSFIEVDMKQLEEFIKPDVELFWEDIPRVDITETPGLLANRTFYNNPKWMAEYFTHCHRSENFRDRWAMATGSWDDRVVVDVGCGPGNLLATLGGNPSLLIGVDIAETSLKMARNIGYIPLLADAQDLPLVDNFADLVVVNATLHHCDDPSKALQEAARIVKPGGLLVIDHDPQLEAWNYQGLGKLMYNIRVPLYRLFNRDFMAQQQHDAMIASELHHRPGYGLTREFFDPLKDSFEYTLCPHNQNIGAEALNGIPGSMDAKYVVGQLFSGINPCSQRSALSIMCVAHKYTDPNYSYEMRLFYTQVL